MCDRIDYVLESVEVVQPELLISLQRGSLFRQISQLPTANRVHQISAGFFPLSATG